MMPNEVQERSALSAYDYKFSIDKLSQVYTAKNIWPTKNVTVRCIQANLLISIHGQ
jgi:hypothetical protein